MRHSDSAPIPIVFSPPVPGIVNRFSSDPSTAYNQGWNEAVNALNTLKYDGVANNASGTPMMFDLENNGNGTCQSAINSFIQGWINFQNSCCPTQVPAVYGSVCGSDLAALAGLNPPPTFIWGADYNGNPDPADLYASGCGVPSGDWVNHQRLKQYDNTHNQPYGGITLSIDDDCADSYTSPAGRSGVACWKRTH